LKIREERGQRERGGGRAREGRRGKEKKKVLGIAVERN